MAKKVTESLSESLREHKAMKRMGMKIKPTKGKGSVKGNSY